MLNWSIAYALDCTMSSMYSDSVKNVNNDQVAGSLFYINFI